MNDHTTLEAPVGTEEAKAELKKKIKAQLKDAMGRTGFELKNFIRVVGPLNMGRVISAGAADKEEWIEEIYRHQSIKHTVKTGELTKDGGPLDRQLILDDLAGFVELFRQQQKVIVEVVNALDQAAKLEVVQDTGHGRGLTIAISYLKPLHGEAGRWATKAADLSKKIQAESSPPDPDSEARVGYARYYREAIEIAADVVGKIGASQLRAQEALEFEAMKAIVTDPDNPKYKTYQKNAEVGLKIASNSMGALETTSDVLGNVPEGHAKSASVGTAAAVSVLKVLQVGFDRIVKSSAAGRDVAEYKKKENVGAAYIALDKKPMLIAELLMRKRVKDIDFVLGVVADPVIRELAPFAPPGVVSTLWRGIRKTIVESVQRYEQKRIDLAKERLLLKEEEKKWKDLTLKEANQRVAELAGKTAEQSLGELKETITSNVFTLLNPVELAVGTAVDALAARIADIVVSALPASPAEDVDGGKLYARVEAITGALKRTLPQQKGVLGPPNCPPTTDEMIAVQVRMSHQLTGEQGRPCWLVRLVDGRVGHLYAMDRTFLPLDPDDPLRDQQLPSKDYQGHKFVWIVPKTTENLGGGMFGSKVSATFKARIGAVEGIVKEHRASPRAEPTYQFTPENVSADGYADWSRRVIFDGVRGEEPGGYYDRDSGDRLKGTWYQPWKGALRYLFVAEDGTCEWAQGSNFAGNRPNTAVSTILSRIQYDSTFNLNSLLA